MRDTLVSRISHRLYAHGISSSDTVVSAVALATAWFEDRNSADPRTLFRAMASRLEAGGHGDGLMAAADWLEDPGFASTQWDALAAALADLRNFPSRPVDWTAELDACFGDRRSGIDIGLTMSVARVLGRVLDIPLSESCACMFPSATSLAWVMSGEQEVTLFAGNRDIAIVTALLARAACRRLKVDRRNPLDGSFMPVSTLGERLDREPPFDRFDHIITVPPFGIRLQDGQDKGLPFETVQIERLASRATHTFSTVVPDGVLFRENRQESALRRELVEKYETTVMSLPPGIFMPAAGVQASIVRLERKPSDRSVRMIDGRSMEKTSSGRVQEQLIVRQLEQFQGLQPRDEGRVELVQWDELEASNFSLLPDRYLKSENLMRIEYALKDHQLVTLDQVATIERSKAPMPIRDGAESPPLAALEIAPSDIVEGLVREPKRRVAFDQSEKSALAKVAIKPGDILVTIKGNVGIVGHVNIEADLAILFDEPWIVSQSLAIIRLKPGGPFETSEVLAAILTAPWVREKLESMSGGSTVRTLPISAVRSLLIPLPTPEQIAEASEQITMVEKLRYNVSQLTGNINETRSAIWHSLWHVAPELEDN
jgi:hypothetical protein